MKKKMEGKGIPIKTGSLYLPPGFLWSVFILGVGRSLTLFPFYPSLLMSEFFHSFHR